MGASGMSRWLWMKSNYETHHKWWATRPAPPDLTSSPDYNMNTMPEINGSDGWCRGFNSSGSLPAGGSDGGKSGGGGGVGGGGGWPILPGLPRETKTWDPITDQRIQNLHPDVRDAARRFINEAANRDIYLRVADGRRTRKEQDAKYAQGRTKPGLIVTWAFGGKSPHLYGLAIDVVPMKNGQPYYASDRWIEIGYIGESYGFEWGGHWKRKDRPHFQMYWSQ